MAAGRTKSDSLARPVFPGSLGRLDPRPGLFIFQNFALLASSFISAAVMSLRERTCLVGPGRFFISTPIRPPNTQAYGGKEKPPVLEHRRLCCESANDNSPLPAALFFRGIGRSCFPPSRIKVTRPNAMHLAKNHLHPMLGLEHKHTAPMLDHQPRT